EPATQAAADEAMAAASEGTGDIAPSKQQQAPTPSAQAAEANGNRFVSPVVARIASEHNVDPSQVSGTGRGGRVTKKDILDFIEQGGRPQPQAQPQPEPQAAPAPQSAPPPPAPPAAPAPPKAPALPVSPAEVQPGEEV